MSIICTVSFLGAFDYDFESLTSENVQFEGEMSAWRTVPRRAHEDPYGIIHSYPSLAWDKVAVIRGGELAVNVSRFISKLDYLSDLLSPAHPVVRRLVEIANDCDTGNLAGVY